MSLSMTKVVKLLVFISFWPSANGIPTRLLALAGTGKPVSQSVRQSVRQSVSQAVSPPFECK